MSYDTNTTVKNCELCNDPFEVRDTRAGNTRLCFNCRSVEPEIKAILNGKSYSLATDEDKRRIVERTFERKTVRYNK